MERPLVHENLQAFVRQWPDQVCGAIANPCYWTPRKSWVYLVDFVVSNRVCRVESQLGTLWIPRRIGGHRAVRFRIVDVGVVSI